MESTTNNRRKITQSSWEPFREESEWEDALLGRLWKNKEWSCSESSFPLSGLMKGICYSEFIFLGEMKLNIQKEEFGLSWRVPFNT